MKISSAPANPEPSAREIAQGCFTSNLMIPGLGSLVGGKKIGYAQMILCFAGLGFTLIFGFRFIYWSLAHWSEMHDPNLIDPFTALHAMWQQARWPLLGVVLFAISWLWAMQTSYRLLDEAKKKSPPRLENS